MTLPTDMRDVYVVVAACNEERTVGKVVEKLKEKGVCVVVVDDGSEDETSFIAREAGAVVLRHLVNRGQGAAIQTGFTYCLSKRARVVCTFDADGQHDAKDIPALVLPIQKGEVDVVLGSRFLEETHHTIPVGRRLLLKGAILFTKLFTRLDITDTHNGLRAFSAKAAASIDIRLDNMAHASELLDQISGNGLSYKEVPVHILYTPDSLKKGQGAEDIFRVASDYLVDRMFR